MMSLGGLLSGAVERKGNGHLLLDVVWDELWFNGSEGVGLGSAARHAGEDRRSLDGSLSANRVD